VIGLIAEHKPLGFAIALTSGVYLAAAALLLLGIMFVRHDAAWN
jgi:hypothetical protein